jgi:hypothetical protein
VSSVFLEHRAVGFPEVAEALALAVALRNPPPEPGAGLGRAVPLTRSLQLDGSYDRELPTAIAYSTASGHMSSTHRVQGHRSPRLTGAHRLLSRLPVPFFEPTIQCIATNAENPTDRPL